MAVKRTPLNMHKMPDVTALSACEIALSPTSTAPYAFELSYADDGQRMPLDAMGRSVYIPRPFFKGLVCDEAASALHTSSARNGQNGAKVRGIAHLQGGLTVPVEFVVYPIQESISHSWREAEVRAELSSLDFKLGDPKEYARQLRESMALAADLTAVLKQLGYSVENGSEKRGVKITKTETL